MTWVIADYHPVSLFALRASFATTSGSKTLLTPTAFAIKMAILNASIQRAGLETGRARFPAIRDLRIAVELPVRITVIQSFAKVLRPPKHPAPCRFSPRSPTENSCNLASRKPRSGQGMCCVWRCRPLLGRRQSGWRIPWWPSTIWESAGAFSKSSRDRQWRVHLIWGRQALRLWNLRVTRRSSTCGEPSRCSMTVRPTCDLSRWTSTATNAWP